MYILICTYAHSSRSLSYTLGVENLIKSQKNDVGPFLDAYTNRILTPCLARVLLAPSQRRSISVYRFLVRSLFLASYAVSYRPVAEFFEQQLGCVYNRENTCVWTHSWTYMRQRNTLNCTHS